MARRLGRDGNKIALAARRADLLREVARQTGPGAIAVTADVTRNVIGTPSAAPPPWTPNAAMTPQTAAEVADAVAELIEHPCAEIYTNSASPEIARRWFEQLSGSPPADASAGKS